MTKIRLAIVGLGWVSTHRHIPAIRRNAKFELVGVADRNPDLARRWAERLGLPHHAQASDLAGISWIDDVDAFDIVTAPMAHFKWIHDALAAGKHVITEKPFAMTLYEGAQLIDTATRSSRQLAVVHNFQFSRSAGQLLKDIERGRIGTVRSVSATQWGNPSRRLPTWYERLPAGLFYDESPHLLYLLRRLTPGPMKLVGVDSCPSTLNLRTPASLDVSYRAQTAAGPIPVTLSCRFEAPLSEWHVAVLGDRGAGIVDVFRDIYLFLPNDGAHVTSTVVRTSWAATFQHWAQHLVNGPLHLTGKLLYGNETVFARFAQAIITGVPPLDISGSDAMAVLAMQHDILSRIDALRDSQQVR